MQMLKIDLLVMLSTPYKKMKSAENPTCMLPAHTRRAVSPILNLTQVPFVM